jgi:hypothetical protein
LWLYELSKLILLKRTFPLASQLSTMMVDVIVDLNYLFKVHKQGIALGRSVDLTKFKGYMELVAELDEMFDFNGELKDSNKEWMVVYTDNEGDMMLVGDDPWE